MNYASGERVLCYHGRLIYEAKVLKCEESPPEGDSSKAGYQGPAYFVHYKGWKQTWDEWVPSSRLLKWNEANLAHQRSLKLSTQAENAGATGPGSSSGARKDGSRTTGGRKENTRGLKRGREEDDGGRRPEMRLSVPDILKVVLVDDWEAVTRSNQTINLPREPNVREILEQFRLHITKNPSLDLPNPSVVGPAVIAGLILYFDKALGANLLYRFERAQYAEVKKRWSTGQQVQVEDQKEMSEIYGVEHLLRMLVTLPAMISTSAMDVESMKVVRLYVQELLSFIERERHTIFQHDYVNASSQYQSLARA